MSCDLYLQKQFFKSQFNVIAETKIIVYDMDVQNIIVLEIN